MDRRGNTSSNSPYVDAQNLNEIYKRPNLKSRGFWARRLWISGRHDPVTWKEFMYGYTMITFGSFLVAFFIPYVSFYAYPGANANVIVALATAFSYLVVSRLPSPAKIRCIVSGPLALGYWCLGEMGLAGVVLSMFFQTLGSLLAGVLTFSLTSNQAPKIVFAAGPPEIARYSVTVPLPLTTQISGFYNVILVEIAISLVLVLLHLCLEFLNTKSYVGNSEKHQRQLTKNFHYAGMWTPVAWFLVVLALYNAQAWTFNNTVYTGGLFAGINLNNARSTVAMAALSDGTIYSGSHWIGNYPAWPHYFFSPLVGGLLAGIIFAVLFYLFADENGLAPNSVIWSRRDKNADREMEREMPEYEDAPLTMAQVNGGIQMKPSSQPQAQPQLRTPLHPGNPNK